VTATNFLPKETFIEVGDSYVDFTLRDTSGAPHTLSEILNGKDAALLQTGSYTCPVYQGNTRRTSRLADSYGDRVAFVHIYTPEAHPMAPDLSPYHGRVFEGSYSDYRQATAYDERVRFAAAVDIGADQLMLVDELAGSGSDPVWCTYVAAPNGAVLIDREGTVRAVHLWFDPTTMEDEIRRVLGR